MHVNTKEIRKKENLTDYEIDSGCWAETFEYRLRPRAVYFFSEQKQIEILKRIRLSVRGNQFDIILSGILTAEPGKSRLKLLADTVVALIRAGIIKGDLSTDESYRTRAYKILSDYFTLAEYEIRIDSSRKTGLPFYKHCKNHSKFSTDFKNTSYLTSPKKSAYKQSGYRIITYDRREKTEKGDSLSPSYFPIRLELRARGKLLKEEILDSKTIGDICRGSSGKVINRLRSLIVSKMSASVKLIGGTVQFDLFCNGKYKGISPESSLNILITNRTIQKQLEALYIWKLNQGEPPFDMKALLEFHGHDMKRKYHFDLI